MGLLDYVIRRLILLVPTLIGVTLLIFGVTQLIDPKIRALLYVTSDKQLIKIDDVIRKYGLDKPFYEQYFTWINEVLHGNLGISKSANNQP